MTMMSHELLTLSPKEKKRRNEIKWKDIRQNLGPRFIILISLSPLRFLLLEKLIPFHTVLFFPFYFTQFLSNFLKYLFLNFPSFYSYNILTIYFPNNSPLLKSFLLLHPAFTIFWLLCSSSPQILPLLPLCFLSLPHFSNYYILL